MFYKLKIIAALLACALPLILKAQANPEKIYLVINSADAESEKVAKHYCKIRNVPEKNIIALKTTKAGLISKATYFSEIENPLIEKLVNLGAINAQNLGTFDNYGRAQYAFMSHDIDYLIMCLGVPYGVDASEGIPSQKINGTFSPKTDAAAIDSELSARFLEQKTLEGSLRNPLFGKKNVNSFKHLGVLRVARLDAKTADILINQLNGIIDAEEKGLRGRAYIDKSKRAEVADKWLEECAKILRSMGFDTDVDEERSVFGFTQRMDYPAFYYAWYTSSISGYFLCENFKVSPGGVAMHIYSFSATALRGENGWCAGLIRAGAGASTGNVYEPFLGSTHRYNAFMIGLGSGLNAGEAAYMSLPTLSWQGVFLGDPLYMPFKKNLDAQLSDIESGKVDELSQYSVIRKMNLMKNEGKNISEILSYGTAFLQKLPKPAALYWKIALLAEESGNGVFGKQFAHSALDCGLSHSSIWQGLAMEITLYLENKSPNAEEKNKIAETYSTIANSKNLPMQFKYALSERAENFAKKHSFNLPANLKKLSEEVAVHKEEEKARQEKIRKEREAKNAK